MSRPSNQTAATCVSQPFGSLADGREVIGITLSNSLSISVRILTLGATVQSLIFPDRLGRFADVALGLSSAADYWTSGAYFGATLGRYANRIAGGRFTLDGRTYQLGLNDGCNALHGGADGFSRRLWTLSDRNSGATASVTLTLESPDGDEGYPGALTVTATFTLRDDRIVIDYRAETDMPTIVNLSNHTYFNLRGEASGESIFGHELTIPADSYLPVDAWSIPTGEFRDVGGTAFDFRESTPVGRRIRDGSEAQIVLGRGYDHTWVFSRSSVADARLVARLRDPNSGRALEILSTQPGLQFYTGNFLDGTAVGKSGLTYRQGDGMSLEPQLFPDTPNRPNFGSARLAVGDAYSSKIIYRLLAT